MEMPYIGPYRVLWGPDERDRYALRDLFGRRFNEFHVSKLKLWPLDNDISDDYYIVDAIIGSRQGQLEREYLVKWRGYSNKYNKWEPLSNLTEAAQAEAARFDANAATGAGSGTAGTGATGESDVSSTGSAGSSSAPVPVAAAPLASSTHTEERAARAAARAEARALRNASQA